MAEPTTISADQFTPDLIGRKMTITFPTADSVTGSLTRFEYRRNPANNGDSEPLLRFTVNVGGTPMEHEPGHLAASLSRFQVHPEDD